MHSEEELLAAAHAVAAEDEDRSGVATYLALVSRRVPPPPTTTTTGPVPGDASGGLAGDLLRAWSAVSAADPATTVQDALAALAWLDLRPPRAGGPGPGVGGVVGGDGDAAGGPRSLAAWSPAGTVAASRAERDADVARVHDAMVAGRVLRVVNYHNTPERDRDALHAELSWYAERFVPATEADVRQLLETGVWPHDRPGIAVALYDGFVSAARVAAPICEEVGLTAWIYPVTELLDADVERQHEIVASRDLGVLPEDLASGARLAMTWDELGDLAQRHVVLGHTDDHVTAASVVTEADVERQVRGPLRCLRERIGRGVAGWAWAGGTPLGDGPGDRALVEEGVPLLVSNCFVERLG